jgi:hypothetical protein
MKSIKISDKSYEYLKRRSVEERRPMTTVLDLIVEKEEKCQKKSGKM